jgi:hypothetical protein
MVITLLSSVVVFVSSKVVMSATRISSEFTAVSVDGPVEVSTIFENKVVSAESNQTVLSSIVVASTT